MNWAMNWVIDLVSKCIGFAGPGDMTLRNRSIEKEVATWERRRKRERRKRGE